ncbi:MAG TPA: GtrA family protein [Alicyclobacillus sp.]|nr:GtrA family protein [Alicyclobacillus sp.]
MNEAAKIWRNRAGQWMRFGMVGMLNTVVDFLVFFVLVRGAHWGAAPAQALSYTCGVCNSYLWNRSFTFRSRVRPGAAEFAKFLLVNALSCGISSLAVLILEKRSWSLPLAKTVVTPLAVGINFAGSKRWVFRSNKGGARR